MRGPKRGSTWEWSAQAASDEIDRFIERRAQEAEQANYAARSWAESVEKFNFAQAAERWEQAIQYHRAQARRLRVTMSALAAEHERAARELAGD